MAILSNLARMHTATLGVGPVTLGAAVAGYNTFAASGIVNGNVVSYGIMDFDAGGVPTQSEVGRGTYSAIGPTLVRTTILDSTNGGAAINLGGNAQVYITAISEDFDHTSGSILNVGTNTHAQIDLHLANVANPHATNAAQVGAPALVNPSVVGNFVSFSGLTGAQQDSGVGAASFQANSPILTTLSGLANAVGWLHNDGFGALAWSIPPGLLGNGAMQYQTVITGVAPFAPGYSGFLLDGTTGGKTVLAVTNAKTLTLTATDNYNLTVPATGTAALLGTANIFTALNTFNLSIDVISGQYYKYNNVNMLFADTVKANWWIANAGNATASGVGNLGIGRVALYQLTSGQYNFAMGDAAGAAVQTGSYNTLMGAGVLGAAKESATSNVGIGTNVFYGAATRCDYSVGIGDSAGRYIANGSTPLASINQCIYIGYAVNALATPATNEIVIGSLATGNGNNTVTLGADTIIATYLKGLVYNTRLTTTNNAILEVARLQAIVSTASTGGAAGFGPGLTLYAETATDGANQLQAQIAGVWVDATNATRKAKLQLYAYDTAARLGMEIEASGSAAKLAFYGGTTVVRGAALTTQLTTITHTAPGTPDYAIQDFAQNGGAGIWGFADHDEANSVLSVIANLQTRVAELEARLGSATGVNLFA